MKLKLLIVGVAMLLLNGPVFADLDPLKNYDNFNKKKVNGCKSCINGKKWGGGERWNTNSEATRGIKAKKVRLTNRVYGNTDSNVGTVQGRNRLVFKDSEDFSGVCFTPRAIKYEITTCGGNESTASAQVRYVGNFYDANNDNVEDGENGLVYAWFGLRRWSDDGNKKGVFNVSGNASQCADADCNSEAWSTYDGVDNPNLNFGTVKGAKNKKELCVGYDLANHELVFSYGDKVKKVTADNHLPPLADRVNQGLTWQVLETRADVHNCPKIRSGYVVGDIDDVKVRRMSAP
jgi:hypothetical protein